MSHFNFNKIILSTKQKELLPLFWQNKKLQYFWRSRQYGFKLWFLLFGIAWHAIAYTPFVRKFWKMLCILKVTLQKIFRIVNDPDMTFSIKYSEMQLCTLCHEMLHEILVSTLLKAPCGKQCSYVLCRKMLRNAIQILTISLRDVWKTITRDPLRDCMQQLKYTILHWLCVEIFEAFHKFFKDFWNQILKSQDRMG